MMSLDEKRGQTAVADHQRAGKEDGIEAIEDIPPPDPASQRNFENDQVTLKTWIVVFFLAWSGGLSFWIVPATASTIGTITTELGDGSAAAWVTSAYTLACSVASMVCGSNSDLFGRRYFILAGNVFMIVGLFIGGSAKAANTIIAGMALVGFGAGNAQLAAFALPELLPNKWRAVGVVISDLFVYVSILIGPIAGRYAVAHGHAWRWLFYAPGVAAVTSLLGLGLLYFPPAHPRGLPFRRALRELDYGGAFLFAAGATLTLTGINYTTILSASNPKVLGTLISGLGTLILFALWETFVPLKQPLTPTHLWTKGRGRHFTAPWIAGFVITMFYYGINIVYPTQIAVFFTDSTTPFTYGVKLTLPQNLGLVIGAALLGLLDTRIKHRKWTLTGALTMVTIFGSLLALGNPHRKNMMMAFVFLAMMPFGWAQALSITYIQMGAEQRELGIAGGLGGVARYAGGSVAFSVYSAILTNVVSRQILEHVPAAAIAAGLPASSVPALLAALPLGAAALEKVPGISTAILEAAGAAYVQAYVVGLRTIALSSIAFGGCGIIACLFLVEITPKMNRKIEVFLENDVNADKNAYH